MTTLPAKLFTPTKGTKLPRRPCETPDCRETLGPRSKNKKCQKCRHADKRWGHARPKEVLERHYLCTVWANRLVPHLPEKVTSITTRRRA